MSSHNCKYYTKKLTDPDTAGSTTIKNLFRTTPSISSDGSDTKEDRTGNVDCITLWETIFFPNLPYWLVEY